MMKRILSILLIAVLVLNCLPVSALAAQTEDITTQDTLLSDGTAPETESETPEEETPDEGWTWNLDGTVLTISGTGPMDDYTYSAAAPWGKTVTEVIIQPGITAIGNYAFYSSTSLVKVTIPDSVTAIGDYAFSGCIALAEIVIPDGVVTVGEYAFNGCTGATSLTVGEAVTSVGEYAFYYCNKLETVYFNAISCESMNNYSDAIFKNCSKLTTFIAGEKVTRIPDSLFQNCTTLTTATLGSSVESIGNSAFSRCSALTAVNIPQSVTTIGEYAFGYCTGLSEIAIPSGVTRIGRGAFSNCTLPTTTYGNAKYLGNAENPYVALVSATSTSITSVEIHPDTAVILNNAFANCTALTAVTIPDGVHYIGYQAFSACSKLEKITLGANVTEIGENAFYRCDALKEAYTPTLEAWLQITFKDDYAVPTAFTQKLYVGGKLLTEVVIPDSVQTIHPYAFYNQRQITSVAIPDSVTAIGEAAFYYTGITSVRIPQGVTELNTSTFSFCTSLAEVVLHDDITAIGSTAFYCCGSLTQIVLPQKLQSLGERAFECCAGLTKITLPNNLQSLKAGVFYGCTSLTELVIPDSVTEISEGALAGMSALRSLTVPFASVCVPETDTTYKSYYPFGYFFGTSSYNQSVATEQNKNKVYASSETVSSTSAYTYYLPKSLTEVTVTDTKIALCAFENCAGLTKVSLPNVKRIGNRAFKNCTGLTTVTLSSQVEHLGTNAFDGCANLAYTVYENGKYLGSAENPHAILAGVVDATATTFQFHENVKTIAGRAFASCTALTTITIPESVTAIGEYAFYGCVGLTQITIPTSVKTIGKNALQSCSGLQSVTLPAAAPESGLRFMHFFGTSVDFLPSGLTAVKITAGQIPQNAFDGCYQLKTITLTDGVTAIGDYAFNGCTGLTYFGIPGSVKTVGDYAFKNCSNVTELVICEGVEGIGDYAFSYCSKVPKLTLPDSLTAIGNYAFEYCSGLKAVTMGANLQQIGSYIFRSCSGITEMTFGKMDQRLTDYFDTTASSIPVTAVTIKSGIVPAGACNGTTKVASVTLKEGVTAIGASAFQGCTAIKWISIPGSVTTIGASAFSGCTALQTVSLKDGLTTIGNQAFRSCTALSGINIPSSVKTIEANAFKECTGLSYHVDGIAKYLGNNDNPKYVLAAITDTTITTFQISEDTGIILDEVFKNFTKLTTVSIPETVTSIGSSAFYSCSALTSVTIPQSVTVIRSYTFYGCKKLTQITIHAGITELGQSAFMGCSGLTRVNTPDLTAWCSIDFFDHPSNPVYLAGNLYVNGTLLTKLEVPASIKILRSSTFAGCTSLKEVIIPDTVEEIEGSVFSCCSNLQSMTIPFVGMQKTAADEYPQYPFGYLFGTTSYTGGTGRSQSYYVGASNRSSSTYYIPTSLKSVTVTGGNIHYGAFSNCADLTTIDASGAEGGVGGYAFNNCKALTNLKLPANITTIGDYAFYSCLKLPEITIPDTVTGIGSYAFYGCSALKKVTIGSGVKTIGSYAFDVCTGLTELTIPDSVTSIGTGILYKCSGIQSLTIPFVGESRKTASETPQYPLGYLFGTDSYTGGTLTKQYYYRSGTTSTTYSNYYIPTSLKTVTVTDGDLHYGAFYGCSNITKICLGDGVLNVVPEAFTGTDSLEAFEVSEDNPNYSSLYRILYNKDQTEIIYIPTNHTYILTVQYMYATGETASATVIQRHKADAAYSVAVPEILGYSTPRDTISGTMPMQDYTIDVIYYENSKLTGGQCTDSLSWTLYQDGSLIFRGTGDIPDYESGGAPWAQYADEVLNVYLDSRITGIGAYAFENCQKLTYIDYGYSVKAIGKYAFAGCSSLASFKLPDSVTAISEGAFSGCTGLTAVTVPDNITAIGKDAFHGCSGLIQVNIGRNVTQIGANAFADCGSLTQVYFRGEPAQLGSSAFGSTGGKYLYYYSSIAGWNDVVIDSQWYGYTAIPYNAIAQEGFDGTNVYIIKVVDSHNTPLAGVTVTLGDVTKHTVAGGLAYFIKPTQPQMLTVTDPNGDHISFTDSAFVPTATQVMDIIELSDRPSVVQGISLNGQSIATTVGVLNCSEDKTVTVTVGGYSKYTIVKYELYQGSRLLSTVKTSDTACTFRVKANAFEEGETVLVRMHTADGCMVTAALNVDVIKLADIAQQQIIDEMSDLDLNVGLGDLGIMELDLPVNFYGIENLYTKVDGRTIYIGINLDINAMLERQNPLKEIKEEIQKSIKPTASLKPEVSVKLAGYLEIEYLGNNEYYIKTSYVKLGIGINIKGSVGGSYYGVVGISCKVTIGAQSTLELYITRFTPEEGFHIGELNFIQDVFINLELDAFILWRAGVANAYGDIKASITLGIIPELAWKQVLITGEIGVKWSALWGLFGGEKVLASGEIYRWPSENVVLADALLSAMRDPNSYETNDRGYLENRTPWQGDGEYLQQNIYDNVAPKIVQCGDTVMMLWLDDNSQRDNANFQTLYYSVYTDGSWSAPVAVDDNGTLDCEFDVCVVGDAIYVVYTEMKTPQSGIETLDIADQGGIDAFINGVEVAVAVYENGSFGEPVQLTDNEVCELLPSVADADGVPTITWVESNAVGLNTETADAKLCTVKQSQNGWSQVSDLADGQNPISAVATVRLQDKVYTAYTVDADGSDETTDDIVLILRSEDGEQLQLDSGVISQVSAAVVAQQQVLLWSNGGKAYMIADGEQTPVCLMPENISTASNFQIVSLDDERTLLLFTAANDAKEQNGTDIYSAYIGLDGSQTAAVQITDTEGYVAGYSAYYRDEKLNLVYTQTVATVADGNVETVSHLRTAAMEFYTDLVIEEVEYDITAARPNTQMVFDLSLRNSGTKAIDGILVNFYDNAGNLVYTAEQALQLDSGEASRCAVTVVLPQEISAEGYRIELVPQYNMVVQTDAQPDNNSVRLELAYADIQIQAEQKVIGEKNYIIMSVANAGNADSGALLQVFAQDTSGMLIGEVETGVIPAGTTQQYIVDIDALTTVEDTVVLCLATATFSDPFQMDNRDVVALFHIQNDVFTKDPEQVILNPEISAVTAQFDKYVPEDIAVQITAEAESFIAIEGLTVGTDYTFSEGRIVISSKYLSSLETGSHILKLVFDFGYDELVVRNFTVTVTDSAPVTITGAVSIAGDAVVGGTVSAELSQLVPGVANVAYCWQIDGQVVGMERSYTVAEQDLGKTLTLTVTGMEGYAGALTAQAVVSLQQPDAPVPPVISRVESGSVSVAQVAGVEYSLDRQTWQDSHIFTGLQPNTSYTVYARVKATETSLASQSSRGTVVTTLKLTVSQPAAPEAESISHDRIVLTAVPGMEYRIEGGQWQSSNVFTGLERNTAYVFYQRYQETDTAYASAESTASFTTMNVRVGDADGDGYVDAFDASLILQYSVGAISADGLNLSVLDVDGDSYVDAFDASLILQYSVGAIAKFPCEE